MYRAFSLRAATALALGGLLSSACIIVSDEEDTGDPTSFDTGDPPGSDSLTTGPDGGDGNDDGGTGSPPPPSGDCSDNLLADPGFEGGTPSAAWTESSELFGTPICDTSCADMPGAEPRSGSWWSWFGGLADAADFATVAQTVTLPVSTEIVLSFWVQIRSGSGTGNDFFVVSVDDQQVFAISDADMGNYSGYTLVELDLTDFGDDTAHTLYFDGDIAGVGLSSFFLDDVALYACSEGGASSTGAVDSTGGVDSTAGSDSGSGSGSGSGTDSGTGSGSGSDSGGSTTGGA